MTQKGQEDLRTYTRRIIEAGNRGNLENIEVTWLPFIRVGKYVCLILVLASIVLNWKTSIPVHVLTAIVANVCYMQIHQKYTTAFTVIVMCTYCATSLAIITRLLGW